MGFISDEDPAVADLAVACFMGAPSCSVSEVDDVGDLAKR
jgi:hypothetical protein